MKITIEFEGDEKQMYIDQHRYLTEKGKKEPEQAFFVAWAITLASLDEVPEMVFKNVENPEALTGKKLGKMIESFDE